MGQWLRLYHEWTLMKGPCPPKQSVSAIFLEMVSFILKKRYLVALLFRKLLHTRPSFSVVLDGRVLLSYFLSELEWRHCCQNVEQSPPRHLRDLCFLWGHCS